MEIALSIVRFLHYSAAIQLFGMAVFETWIAPEGLSTSLLPLSRPISVFNVWILFLSAVAWLGLEAGYLGDGWVDVVNPATIWLVISATPFGQAWIANLLLGLMAVVIVHTLGLRRASALAVVGTLALAALSFVGHAVDQTGALLALSEASQVVHLLSSGFWFGSLLSVVLLLRRLRDPRYTADCDFALRRFSGLGHAAVALALGTGLANSWFILHDQPLTLGSLYQLLLLIKVALVGTMCVVALINRYVFMPRIPRNGAGLHQLRDGTVAELVIGTVVIAIIGVLGLLSPS
jgi:putative copper resistance protein D